MSPKMTRAKLVGIGGTGAAVLRATFEAGLSTAFGSILVASDPMTLETSFATSTRLAVGAARGEQDSMAIARALGEPDIVLIATHERQAPLAAAVATAAQQAGALVVTVGQGGFAPNNPALEGLAAATDTLVEVPSGAAGVLGYSIEDILALCVGGILRVVTEQDFMAVTFADLCTATRGQGHARMGLGLPSPGLTEAARRALVSPLLAGSLLRESANVLLVISTSTDIRTSDIRHAVAIIKEAARPAEVTFHVSRGPETRLILYAIGTRPPPKRRICATALLVDRMQTGKPGV